MTTYTEKLERAKAISVLTAEEFASAGGSYFDEDMGLWIRQDADGGGIVPFAWQMDMTRSHDFSPELRATIIDLFIDLGRVADIKAYSKE